MTALRLMTECSQVSCETEPALETGSDRKVAYANPWLARPAPSVARDAFLL
jgi:hypothetical protein